MLIKEKVKANEAYERMTAIAVNLSPELRPIALAQRDLMQALEQAMKPQRTSTDVSDNIITACKLFAFTLLSRFGPAIAEGKTADFSKLVGDCMQRYINDIETFAKAEDNGGEERSS